jgi:8-oxo-dGTP diphosphatase
MSDADTVTRADPAAPRQFTRISAYALCLDGAGRMLLCRISPGEGDAGWWTLPGGGLAFGEDPVRGCLRELEEETGLLGEILDLAGVDSRRYVFERETGQVEMHAIRILYRVAITGGTLRDEVDESTDRSAWFGPGEVAELPLVDLVETALPLFQRSPG